MSGPRYRRVSPSGVRGRLVRFAASSFWIPVFFIAALRAPYVPGGSWEAFVWFSGCLLVPWTWCCVRLTWTGVFFRGDDVIARSWFTTKRYPRSVIVRFRDDAYSGLIFLTGWAVIDGILHSGHLIIETSSGFAELGGTVTSRKVSRLQAERINRFLAVPAGNGDGPRRRARTERGVEDLWMQDRERKHTTERGG